MKQTQMQTETQTDRRTESGQSSENNKDLFKQQQHGHTNLIHLLSQLLLLLTEFNGRL